MFGAHESQTHTTCVYVIASDRVYYECMITFRAARRVFPLLTALANALNDADESLSSGVGAAIVLLLYIIMCVFVS